jgi:DNA-binding response OmpR family regulator
VRLLLVEDSVRLQRSLGLAFRRSGYAVDIAGDGEEGLWLAETNNYDAVVLDVMLPKMDGLDVLRSLRLSGKATHILLLTARDTVSERVAGLEAGADDYLVKPFALEELLARVQALCRRAYGSKQPRLGVSDLQIDPVARSATRAGQTLELTAREYQLLEYLGHRLGEVVSRRDIEAHIYDGQVDPMSNVVDSAICSLRKKMAIYPKAEALIQTRRGLGYVLEAPKNSVPPL